MDNKKNNNFSHDFFFNIFFFFIFSFIILIILVYKLISKWTAWTRYLESLVTCIRYAPTYILKPPQTHVKTNKHTKKNIHKIISSQSKKRDFWKLIALVIKYNWNSSLVTEIFVLCNTSYQCSMAVNTHATKKCKYTWKYIYTLVHTYLYTYKETQLNTHAQVNLKTHTHKHTWKYTQTGKHK